MDTCRPWVSYRSYVIPRNFGFGLYLICCMLRYRAGRHLASCVFVVKKEHSDFGAWCATSCPTLGITSRRCRAKRRVLDHRYLVGFHIPGAFLALCPRHPPSRAKISTYPLPHILIEFSPATPTDWWCWDPGPAPRCGVCRKWTTAKSVICCTCQKSIH